MSAFRCAVVGQGALLATCAESLLARGHALTAVVTRDAEATRFAERHGIPVHADPRALLDGPRLDLLLSIHNLALVPAEVVAHAARAVNLHDAPLPRYAGFFAPTRALLAHERRHGVTWHEMEERADAGAILVARDFDIAEDENAFTLSGKCFEAAVAAFGELLDGLEKGTLAPRAQDAAGRTYFRRSRRPAGEALVSFAAGAEAVARVARALDFGPSANPLALPKLAAARGFLAFRAAEVLPVRPGASTELAGTVLEAAGDTLRVATSTHDVALRSVAPLRVGVSLPTRGERLVEPSSDLRGEVALFDEKVALAEERFTDRLRNTGPSALPYGFEAGVSTEIVGTPTNFAVPVPAAFDALAASAGIDRASALTAAFGALLGRLSGAASVDVGFVAEVPDELRSLYAAAVPLRVELAAGSFEELVQRVADDIAQLRRDGTFALDLPLRLAGPGAKSAEAPRFPVSVALDGRAPSRESALTLVVDARGARLVHAPHTFPESAAHALARQLSTLLASIAASPGAPLDAHDLVGDEERALVRSWNDTAAPYEPLRIDEQIAAQTSRTPDEVALVFRGRAVSYRELDARAARIAGRLRRLGAGPGTLVGVFAPRSVELVAGLLGVLKSGAAYVPLDPEYPADRLLRTLEATSADLVATTRALASSLPEKQRLVVLDEEDADEAGPAGPEPLASATRPASDDVAYVLFTSGSTGRPKGVEVTHRNVASFFAGMDRALGEPPRVFLALTSIAFDISVLELFYTLARGSTVVLQEEDRLGAHARPKSAAGARPLDFSLFYFAAEAGGAAGVNGSGHAPGGRYRLLLDGARFADRHGFAAVWTPERHFHSFGGLYPNPSVTGAALAAITERIAIRAGSVVMPLHDPIRVAEEWSVVDNLSGGRVGVSFASGWHANDFALAPERYAARKDAMLEGIDAVRRLWRGESLARRSGDGSETEVRVMPPPVQRELPFWLTAAGNIETFRSAGTLGANLLTNLLGQDVRELAAKIAAYREARREAGHAGPGVVTLMVHTFLGEDEDAVKETVRGPFSAYLATSFDLIKMAPTAFPAFRQPSLAAAGGTLDASRFTDEDRRALVEHAFSRYVETSGLFGTPASARERVEAWRAIGVDELACLVDFGVPADAVLAGLAHLDTLRASCAAAPQAAASDDFSIAAQIARHGVTHLQCTPSLARLLLADPAARAALSRLSVLLVGGEALPLPLAKELAALVPRVVNMYGPTETTVWSSTSEVAVPVEEVTLGRPIANTTLHVLEARESELRAVPLGVVGELFIGGHGVAKGYRNDPATTAARFLDHAELGRVYRTGDLVRRRADGTLEFHGRADQQVKLSGHRVELGDVEAALASVPGVAAGAAAVKDDGASGLRLVAYVVPAHSGDDGVSRWRAVWDETYRRRTGGASEELAGWRSAITGEPIPRAEMDEWVDATVDRILALGPRRVLEIGCGSGLLLTRIAPSCDVYEGTDVSEAALALLEEKLARAPIASVRLARRAADDFADTASGAFDLVVLNSVAQYFPDAAYLARVLTGAAGVLAPGGAIFLGDVKSLPHLRALHAEAELFRAPASLPAERLAERVNARIQRDTELALDPAFVNALASRVPRLTGVSVARKRGRSRNELTRYRYDALLRLDTPPASAHARAVTLASGTLEELRAHAAAGAGETARGPTDRPLDGAPDARRSFVIRDLEDPRLARPARLLELLEKGEGTAAEIRARLAAHVECGLEPEDVLTSDLPYDIAISPAASGALDRYDAALRPHGAGGSAARDAFRLARPSPEGRTLESLANRPAQRGGLEGAVLASLRERLPEYMVPAAVVVLDALPLTPNGKVDRKALPAVEPARPSASAADARPPRTGAAPEGDVERSIAAVWRDLLGTPDVPRDVNFFDLGANSLLMLEATGRLAAALGRETSLVEMFRFPSVKALAAHVAAAAATAAAAQAPGDDGASAPAGAVSRSHARGEKRREMRERRRPGAPAPHAQAS